MRLLQKNQAAARPRQRQAVGDGLDGTPASQYTAMEYYVGAEQSRRAEPDLLDLFGRVRAAHDTILDLAPHAAGELQPRPRHRRVRPRGGHDSISPFAVPVDDHRPRALYQRPEAATVIRRQYGPTEYVPFTG